MIDNITRDKFVKEISKCLGNSTSINVEEGIYTFSVSYAEDNGTPFLTEQIYITKAEEIVEILEGSSLQYIITSIKNKKIDPKKLAYLRKSELVPDLENNKNDLTIKGSNIFECKKCKKRNVSIEEKQTRAADEPATLFITCLECGNTWRIG